MRYRTITYESQQNSIAKRMNRTLLNRVRYMLLSSGVPKLFWEEAAKTDTHSVNQCPINALNFHVPESV